MVKEAKPPPSPTSELRLTFFLWLALHLQVHGGEAELVAVLGGQLLLLQAVAHTETASHRGHLAVELLPCDLVVKAQPVEFDFHTEEAERKSKMNESFYVNSINGKYVVQLFAMFVH